MDKVVKEFKGHSGSKVYLMEDMDILYVKKIGNVERNIERLKDLHDKGYPVPKLYYYDEDYVSMEYIHGMDMKNYLIHNNINQLSRFIINTLSSFGVSSTSKYYTDIYDTKISWIDGTEGFPFKKEELIARLPEYLPQSTYHGDMTLENIMSGDDQFYMIAAVSIEYDSYIFDIAKMRQDLECKWFIRNDDVKLDVKLKNLQDRILEKFPLANNDYLLILMLLRVYKHTVKGDPEHEFIMKEIKRLWK